MLEKFMKPVFVVVDVQNDFVPPDGALAVPEGQAVVPVINTVSGYFDLVVATQDWHPPDHHSFVDQGGPWPAHCVRDTFGAELHSELEIEPALLDKVGITPDNEGYSAFDESPLHGWLKEREVDTLFFAGLATDYCVKASVLDSLSLGYSTFLIEDGCRAVNVSDGDGQAAIDEMRLAGAEIVSSGDVKDVLSKLSDGLILGEKHES